MWIKKITSRLYLYVLACVVLAGVVSLCIWYSSSFVLEQIETAKYEATEQAQKLVFDELVTEIEGEIQARKLTARDVARHGDYADNQKFDLFFITATGKILYGEEENEFENNSIFEKMYIYPIEFSDGAGFIVINPLTKESISDFYEMITVVIAILAFIFITLITIRKQLQYIEEIDKEIGALSQGDLQHRIEVKGHNELTHLAKSINEMSKSLQAKIENEKQADLKQRTLITNISHDLRTPLTSVIGYLNLLNDKKYKDEAEAIEYLEKAKQKSNHLQNLLNDLFSYTKLTNGDIPYRPLKIDLHTFMLQYLEMQEIDVEVAVTQKDLSVVADVDWLQRIMDNLFDNIRKYAVKDEPIKLMLQRDNNSVTLILQNKTEEDLSGKSDFLFDRMYVSKESRTNTSSGLGLAIVAESMGKMGGRAYANFENKTLQIILEFEL